MNDFEKIFARATIGGTASVIGGGKFENGAATAAFAYLFNECAHGGCGWGDTKVMVYGNYAAEAAGKYYTNPSSVHLEIRIQNGYSVTTIEGQFDVDAVKFRTKTVAQFDNPHPKPIFEFEFRVPNGMSTHQLVTNIVEAANTYSNSAKYSFPNRSGNMGTGYNSNSFVSGVLMYATGQYQPQVLEAVRGRGFLAPGYSNPIPII